jgi:hypothetical protein
MLFLFRGRYALAARLIVGAAVLVVGLLTASKIVIVVGALVLAWGAVLVIGWLSHRGQASQDET